ncbi:MAG: type IV secretory system conjugative DNA transfer family protein [Nitrososphaeria archaeon]
MIVGASGAGKTNLLLYIMQELAGREASIIFVDPHGDASLQLRATVPWTKVYDPVYAPFALNPMDLGSYSGQEERRTMVQRRVGELVNMMKDLFGVEQSRTPRLLWIFRGLLYYLYSLSDAPTFLDLYFLLSELMGSPSRIRGLMKGGDEVVRRTAEAIAELEPAAFTAIMNRISSFVMPAGSYASRTFCTRRSTVDFSAMVSSPGVHAFRLARSLLPEDFRVVLTSTVILNVFFAVERRKRAFEQEGRQLFPVFLVIDEFQTVSSLETLDVILSEARKFGLFLITANQSLSQLPADLLRSLENNSRLIFAFRVGPDDAAELARAMGRPGLESLLVSLPNYTAIVKAVDGVYYFRVPRARTGDERRALEEIATSVALEEDRRPIYYAAGRAPPLSPSQWAVLTFIHLRGPGVSYEALRSEMFRRYAWDESVTLSAINSLLDGGHVRASACPGSTCYEVAPTALRTLFAASEEAALRRAAGPEQGAIVRALVRRFWEAGYWADAGDERAPGIIVFRPLETLREHRGVVKRMRDPDSWGAPEAYVVETLSGPAGQIAGELRRSLEMGYRVVFVVPSEERARKLREILGEGEYSVLVLQPGATGST